jgi:hypothetical protein
LRFFALFLFILPLSAHSQYNSRFTQGYYVEAGGFSRGLSFNYTRMFLPTKKSFVAGSIGAAYIWGASSNPGEPNPMGFENSGLGIPVTATYNYSLGNLDYKLVQRFNRDCYRRPPRLLIDWFLEGGGGLVPSFYNKNSPINNKVIVQGYAGIRTQIKAPRPYKENDIVWFTRLGFSPYYASKTMHFSSLGSVSFSLGCGF